MTGERHNCTLCKPLKLGISLFSCLPCFLTNTDGYPVTRGYKFYFRQLLSQLYFQKPGVAPPRHLLVPNDTCESTQCGHFDDVPIHGYKLKNHFVRQNVRCSVEHPMPIFSLKSQMTRRIWKHLRALGCIPIFPNP